jgi:hypothetical protein
MVRSPLLSVDESCQDDDDFLLDLDEQTKSVSSGKVWPKGWFG